MSRSICRPPKTDDPEGGGGSYRIGLPIRLLSLAQGIGRGEGISKVPASTGYLIIRNPASLAAITRNRTATRVVAGILTIILTTDSPSRDGF